MQGRMVSYWLRQARLTPVSNYTTLKLRKRFKLRKKQEIKIKIKTRRFPPGDAIFTSTLYSRTKGTKYVTLIPAQTASITNSRYVTHNNFELLIVFPVNTIKTKNSKKEGQEKQPPDKNTHHTLESTHAYIYIHIAYRILYEVYRGVWRLRTIRVEDAVNVVVVLCRSYCGSSALCPCCVRIKGGRSMSLQCCSVLIVSMGAVG